VPTSSGGSSTIVPIEIPSAAMTIQEIPRGGTAPVLSSGVSDLAVLTKSTALKTSSGSNGLNLTTFTQANFPSSSSSGGCLAANDAQQAIAAAAQADYQLCLIQSTVGAQSATALGFDLYDGSYHTVNLSWSGHTYPVRLKVVRPSTLITSFEMEMCQGIQVNYSTHTLTANSDGTTALAERTISTSSSSMQTDITVTGTLNSSLQFTRKLIQENYVLNLPSFAPWCQYSATQTSSTLAYNGACNDANNSWSTQVLDFQLYDNNTSTAMSSYTPKLLAMGDGGIVVQLQGGTTNLQQAWTYGSDTLTTASSANSYLTAARATTAASVPSQFAVSYGSGQTWNCQAATGETPPTVTVSPGDLSDSCGRYIDITARERVECFGLDSTATP